MFNGAKIFGCAAALMFGIQAVAAADLPDRKSDCVNNQRVDYNGQVVHDANGYPVPCGAWIASAEDQGLFAGDMPLYLGAGAALIGGGIAAAVVTSSSSGNGAGGSSQQDQLIYMLLLNNNRNFAGGPGGNPASP